MYLFIQECSSNVWPFRKLHSVYRDIYEGIGIHINGNFMVFFFSKIQAYILSQRDPILNILLYHINGLSCDF